MSNNKITSMKEVKTVEDFLKFKYINPSYGGETTSSFRDERELMEADAQPLMYFTDSETFKVYALYVHDIDVWVVNQTKYNERYNIMVRVSNINSNDSTSLGQRYTVREINGSCYSPFSGDKPTEYNSVQCKFEGADLSVFDQYL